MHSTMSIVKVIINHFYDRSIQRCCAVCDFTLMFIFPRNMPEQETQLHLQTQAVAVHFVFHALWGLARLRKAYGFT